MTLLSLCMPSNRRLKDARASIDSALIYAEKVDAVLIISDNSGDAEKRAHYEHASPRLIYLASDGLPVHANHARALSRVETEFVTPMGDDDEIYLLDDVPRIDLGSLPADVAGLRPQTFIWTKERGVNRVDRFPIEADGAGERLMEYNNKAINNNSFYYSCYRTSLFRGLLRLFQASHPTRGGYCDWAMSFTFAAAGKFLHDPATIYRYDLGRWSTQKGLEEAKQALFAEAGLPSEAENFSMLLRFVDTHVFLQWKGLNLTQTDRQEAQTANAQLMLAGFLQTVQEAPEIFPADVPYLADLIRAGPSLEEAFQISLIILDRLQEGLSTRYVTFSRAALAGN